MIQAIEPYQTLHCNDNVLSAAAAEKDSFACTDSPPKRPGNRPETGCSKAISRYCPILRDLLKHTSRNGAKVATKLRFAITILVQFLPAVRLIHRLCELTNHSMFTLPREIACCAPSLHRSSRNRPAKNESRKRTSDSPPPPSVATSTATKLGLVERLRTLFDGCLPKVRTPRVVQTDAAVRAAKRRCASRWLPFAFSFLGNIRSPLRGVSVTASMPTICLSTAGAFSREHLYFYCPRN